MKNNYPFFRSSIDSPSHSLSISGNGNRLSPFEPAHAIDSTLVDCNIFNSVSESTQLGRAVASITSGIAKPFLERQVNEYKKDIAIQLIYAEREVALKQIEASQQLSANQTTYNYSLEMARISSENQLAIEQERTKQKKIEYLQNESEYLRRYEETLRANGEFTVEVLYSILLQMEWLKSIAREL